MYRIVERTSLIQLLLLLFQFQAQNPLDSETVQNGDFLPR